MCVDAPARELLDDDGEPQVWSFVDYVPSIICPTRSIVSFEEVQTKSVVGAVFRWVFEMQQRNSCDGGGGRRMCQETSEIFAKCLWLTIAAGRMRLYLCCGQAHIGLERG